MGNLKVLVTGASGFIGLPLVEKLSSSDCEVMALSRKGIEATAADTSAVYWCKADLSLPETYQKNVKAFSPDVVIHLSWQDIPDFSLDKSLLNVNQSLEFLSFILEIGSCNKILVSGSCFELNRLKGVRMESEKGIPKDDFTWAKHTLHSWLEVACAKKEIELGWMRVFYVYGPRQRTESLIPSILTHLQNGELPELRTPKNANDFVFVQDAASAFSNAVSIPIPSGIYHIGAGFSTSVLEICRQAEQIVLGSDSLTCELEQKTKESVCDVDFCADYSNAEQFFDYLPKTSLLEGLEKTWQWLSSN